MSVSSYIFGCDHFDALEGVSAGGLHLIAAALRDLSHGCLAVFEHAGAVWVLIR